MKDFYINSTSQDQSYDYSNITSIDDKHIKIIHVVTCIIIAIGLPLILLAIYALYSMRYQQSPDSVTLQLKQENIKSPGYLKNIESVSTVLQVRSDHVAPIYVINLLISDLLQLISMIVEVAQHVPNKAIHIYYFSLFASVGFMVCIALGRYLVIAHPLWYRFRRTIKTSVAVCVLVWVLSLVYAVYVSYVVTNKILAVLLLLPFPLLIFFLVGTLRALSAAISVPSDEKRRIVGILVLVLLIYTLLFLPDIIMLLGASFNKALTILSLVFLRLSPLADLVLYVFMRKGAIDKLLASVCCCRMDSNEISSSSV